MSERARGDWRESKISKGGERKGRHGEGRERRMREDREINCIFFIYVR